MQAACHSLKLSGIINCSLNHSAINNFCLLMCLSIGHIESELPFIGHLVNLTVPIS